MARITPPANKAGFVELEDHELYEGTLVNIDWGKAAEQYGGGHRLIVDWQIGDDPSTVRDWLGLSLGMQPGGRASQLRQLLNSLSHRKATDEIAWFDDETLEWGYDKDTAENKLELGMTVGFRGVNVDRADGSGMRFAINVYQAMKKEPVAAGRSKPKPVAAADEDETPF